MGFVNVQIDREQIMTQAELAWLEYKHNVLNRVFPSNTLTAAAPITTSSTSSKTSTIIKDWQPAIKLTKVLA